VRSNLILETSFELSLDFSRVRVTIPIQPITEHGIPLLTITGKKIGCAENPSFLSREDDSLGRSLNQPSELSVSKFNV
jgi:hypothetical protein